MSPCGGVIPHFRHGGSEGSSRIFHRLVSEITGLMSRFFSFLLPPGTGGIGPLSVTLPQLLRRFLIHLPDLWVNHHAVGIACVRQRDLLFQHIC